MTILWWQWLLLGLALMVAELATPGGFYMIFFGVAAVIVGLLGAAGVATDLQTALALFALLSVSTLLLFRTRLLRRFQAEPQRPPVDQLVGEVGTADEDLAPGQFGRVELRGTAWSAQNHSAVAVPRGTRVRVLAVDGLTLHVEPEGARA